MLALLLTLVDDADRAKVTELYHRYHTEMLKVAGAKLRQAHHSMDLVPDVVQNAYIKICDRFEIIRFDRDEREIEAYIMSIVANEAYTILRRKPEETVSFDDLDEDLPCPDDFVEDMCTQVDFETVVCALKALDDRYSIPLELKYIKGLKTKTIAELLNLNTKTVYTNLERGKALLFQKLRSENFFD